MIIHIPNKSILVPDDEIKVCSHMAGWFRITAAKADAYGQPIEDSRRVVADWFPNLITNQGLDRIGANADWLAACQVGSGNAVPQVTDTGLQARVGGSNNIFGSSASAQASAPYYGARTNTYRFSAGTATGNLSEVGVGWSTTGSTLFSRALILDGIGNPTTITVLSDEVLDVTYQFRIYPPTADVIGSRIISGVSYNYTLRAAQVTAASTWSPAPQGSSAAGSTGTGLIVYSGDIGAITSFPSGSSSTTASVSSASYSSNSLERSFTGSFGLTQGNVTGGVKSALAVSDISRYQCQFDPVIPKDSTKTLTLTFKHSWARKTL